MEDLFFLKDVRMAKLFNLNLLTDASGANDFDAIFGSHWCFEKWLVNWEYQSIAILEIYRVVLSLYLWRDAISNQCILPLYR